MVNLLRNRFGKLGAVSARTREPAMEHVSKPNLIGHNVAGALLRVEVRFFNSLSKFTRSETFAEKLEVVAGSTVGDLIDRFKLPVHDIFLVLKNGRDITPGLYQGGVVNRESVLDDGDVIAFSGPVPYSYGYGAPVV
jgi:hypothetical protein